MSVKGPNLLLLAVVFAGGIALGSRFGGQGASARSAEGRPAAFPAADSAGQAAALADALEPSLVELRRALGALTMVLEREPTRPPAVTPPSPSDDELVAPARRPVGTEDARDTAALAAAIARLADAVATLERTPGAAARRPSTPLVTPAWVDREAVFAKAPLRDAARIDDDGSAFQAAEAVFQQQHMLWSTQDLLSTYGKPDQIEVNGDQAQWTYHMRFRGGEEWFHFWVHDETVIQTSYDWDFFE